MPKIRKKRPCCICHRWFLPDAKVKDRQVTCGHPECQKKQHKKQCAKWNRKNTDYFRSNYLQKKLDKVREDEPTAEHDESSGGIKDRSTLPSILNLPIQPTTEIIHTELLVIIDYAIKIQIFQFQKRLMQRAVVNKGSPFL
jgi:hypothetical protein